MFELSDPARITAGFVLLAAITVTTGGYLLTRISRGKMEATDFQKSFYRARHAHAGVLIILGLVCLILTEASSLTGGWLWLSRAGVLISAILMPAGFFFSAMGKGRTQPSAWITLLWIGAIFLVSGLAACGIGLLVS